MTRDAVRTNKTVAWVAMVGAMFIGSSVVRAAQAISQDDKILAELRQIRELLERVVGGANPPAAAPTANEKVRVPVGERTTGSTCFPFMCRPYTSDRRTFRCSCGISRARRLGA
jgi:hypothetical protein